MKITGLILFCSIVLFGCVSNPKVNNDFAEGNYVALVADVERQHKSLNDVPLHKLYFLCPAYYELREYSKFNDCAEFVLAHPDPGTEFYPGLDFTYINKDEFKGYIKSYQARMLLEFSEYAKAYALADEAYHQLWKYTSTDVNEGRRLSNIIAPLEVKALALIYQGQGSKATPLIDELQSLNYYSPGRSLFFRLKQTALAKVYFALQDYASARQTLENEVADPFKALLNPFMLLIANVSSDENIREGALRTPELYMLTKSYMETGDTARARQGFDSILANPIISSLGEIHWAALRDRAVLSWREGDKSTAIELLKQAVAVIESQRSSIEAEAYKIGFVGDKQAVYELLIKYLAAQNRATDAFVYAEKAKARALVDMLAQKQSFASSDAALKADLAELARLEKQLQQGTVAAIKSAERTRGLIIRQREVIQAESPEVASLVSVGEVKPSAIQQQLGADEQLIEFFGSGDELYAFIVDRKTITMRTLAGRNLAENVSRFRQDIMNTGSNGWQSSSLVIYNTLIKPITGDISADKLVIVPHGPLHYLPFAALYDGSGFFIDQHSIRVLPSASVMTYINASPRTADSTLLALGNPALGEPELDLPGAQSEVNALAKVVPDAVVAVREQATESLFKTYAPAAPILHIASHGEFNPKAPLASRLLLVGDDSNDGSLTVSELYDLQLNSELVTLSACQTGLGDVQSGDDVIGLTRGFLFAGAANIVASLWMVDDAATAQLMVDFYQNLRHEDKQQALRDAQLAVKKSYQMHPYYWAAFQLTGSGM